MKLAESDDPDKRKLVEATRNWTSCPHYLKSQVLHAYSLVILIYLGKGTRDKQVRYGDTIQATTTKKSYLLALSGLLYE